MRARVNKAKKRKLGQVEVGALRALLDGAHEAVEQLGVHSKKTVGLGDVNDVGDAGRVD